LTSSPSDVTNLFSLTPEEAFVLAVAKAWLMSQDLQRDPDLPDQEAKHPALLQYTLELHRAFQQDLDFDEDDVPDPTRDGLLSCMRESHWARPTRRALGDANYETLVGLLSDWLFVSAALKTVTSRARGVLLSVELAAFYPWPPGIKYEDGVRADLLGQLVDAMAAPISAAYLQELDRALVDRARKLALKNINWGRIGLLAGGGAVLSVMTMGVATPLLAAAMGGGAWGAMTYAGFSAVGEAGGVLFGNPLAAGGYTVAGATLGTATVAESGGSTMTLNDLVKLDVLTEYYLIRERNEPDLARAVVAAAESRVRRTEAELADIRERVDDLQQLVGLQAQTEQLLAQREAELEQTKQTLADTQKAGEYQRRELERLREFVPGTDLMVHG
jgi:hypothetical protein